MLVIIGAGPAGLTASIYALRIYALCIPELTTSLYYDVIDYIMDIQQVINDTDYSVRTQISLSPSLYRLIKERAKREDKSLAQVIREKVLAQLKREDEKEQSTKEELIRLIQKIREIRESGGSGWAKVKNPHKLIRNWREQEDKKREEMMAKALR